MSEVWRTKLPLTEKMVLLVIADHASDEGDNAWPSQQTIATRASLSVRTVQRTVNKLVASGWLKLEKRAGGTQYTREDRRPNLYTIRLKMLRGGEMTGRRSEPNEAALAPDTGRRSRPMNHSNKPSLTHPEKFDEFWEAYPRKTAKGAARKAWEKIKAGDQEAVIAGALRFASDPNREAAFTPYPATWLNSEQWLDDPLPQKPPQTGFREANSRPTVQPPRFTSDEVPRGVPMPESLKEILKRV